MPQRGPGIRPSRSAFKDMKRSVNLDMMTPAVFASYAEVCGRTLARAHARTGDAAMGLVLVRRSHGPQHGHIFRLASRGGGPGQEARR